MKSVSVFGKDFPFPAGERETLLKIQVPMGKNFDKKPYQDFVDKFDTDFVYESMYGEMFTHTTKDNEDQV